MRKLFTLLTMCLLASSAWAVDVVFDATVDVGTGSSTAGAFYIEKEGVRIEVAQGMANGQHYRFYKNQPVIISAPSSEITKVVFTCTAQGEAQYGPGNFTVDTGDYTFSGAEGTWTGGSSSIQFLPSKNQVRATKIVVTVGAAGLSAPVIKPAAGTYYDPIQVSMTCSTSGAKIYYTTNGSNPTTSSTQYTAPFTLSTNTTVKAISEKDGEVSDVVTAAYAFATATSVNNLAAYSAVADETVVKFANPVNVLAQNNRYLYVKDNSGYGLFYGDANQNYELGDVIPAGFVGTKTTYGGEPELTQLSGFNASSDNVTINAEPITTAQVDHNHWAHYVYFENATIDPDAKTLTDATGTAPVYFSMGVTASQVTAGVEYEVWAIVGSYKPNNGDVVYQILPVKVKRHGGGGVGIGTMGDYDDNTMLTFEYDATVLYHGNSRLFVKDETGYGLIYGNVGQTYHKGDIIPAGYGGKKTTYGGEPELATPFSGFQAAAGSVTVDALKISVLDVNHEHFANYVELNNVTVSDLNGNNFKITDANGKTCNGYNQFGQDIQEGFYASLKGIVGSYKQGNNDPVYQLLPIIEAAIIDVRNINELYALNSGRQAHFTQPLTTIYQNGANLYVKDVDGTYSLAYGSVAGTFENGDYINDAVASWSTYQGNKQLIPDGNTFVKAGHGTPVQPEIMAIEEVSQDMVHWFLGFEEVEIAEGTDAEGNASLMMTDETGSIKLFDRFHVLENIQSYDGTFYVEGFLTVFRGELEFYPSLVLGGTPPDPGMKGDVNNDKEINIADVNALIDIILSGGSTDPETFWRADVAEDSELGIADVNALIDIILSE